MKWFIGACLTSLVVGAAAVIAAAQRPVDGPLWESGETYAVAWDCIPVWVAEYASQAIAGGRPLNPCYTELLKVIAVRRDGWVVVTEVSDGHEWTINPSRAMAIKKQTTAPPKPGRVPTGLHVARSRE